MTSDDTTTIELATQGSITFVGKILTRLLGFLFVIVATRLLSPSEYGVYALGLAIVMFLRRVATLSLNQSVDYFVPQLLSDGDEGTARGLVVTAFLVALTTTLVVVATLLLYSDSISLFMSEPRLKVVLPLFALLLFFYLVQDIATSVFDAVKQMRYRVYVDNVTRPVGRLILGVGLVVAGYGVVGLVAGHVFAIGLSALVGVILLFRNVSWMAKPGFQRYSPRELVKYSVPLAVSGSAVALVTRIDYFVIGYFIESADVGVYRISVLLAANLIIFHASLNPVFKPMIAESIGDPDAVWAQYRLATRWITLFSLPVAAVLVSGPSVYLNFFFTPEYSAQYVLSLLVIGQLLNIAFGPAGQTLAGLGYSRLNMFNSLFLVTTNFTVDILLVPRIGILGAAIGTATGLTLTGILAAVEVGYVTGFDRIQFGTARMWISIVPAYLLAEGVLAWMGGGLVTVISLPVVVSVMYLCSLRLIGVFEEEDATVASTIDGRIGWPIFQYLTGTGVVKGD